MAMMVTSGELGLTLGNSVSIVSPEPSTIGKVAGIAFVGDAGVVVGVDIIGVGNSLRGVGVSHTWLNVITKLMTMIKEKTLTSNQYVKCLRQTGKGNDRVGVLGWMGIALVLIGSLSKWESVWINAAALS